MREVNLDYIHTYDMSMEEIERWEKEHDSIALIGASGETIELWPSYSYIVDENHKSIAGTEKPVLVISVCTEDAEEEFMFSMSDKDRIKRLRDYLNDYLEGRITHNIPFHVI
jgi:hypothetical protein